MRPLLAPPHQDLHVGLHWLAEGCIWERYLEGQDVNLLNQKVNYIRRLAIHCRLRVLPEIVI
jgi:hypothetical protein